MAAAQMRFEKFLDNVLRFKKKWPLSPDHPDRLIEEVGRNIL